MREGASGMTMECNKEEAIRAKEIAEEKMRSKNFSLAHKLALKAKQLYPELENISQMLIVCEVHCSAELRLFGNEMDWYGILQIQQTADEVTIKKQYRKFALLLHPDKNKFAGAEAAFKLIGEAQRVLLDQSKRSLYDIRRKTLIPKQPPQRPSSNSNVGVQSNFSNSFARTIPQPQNPLYQTQPAFSQTFWTVCPFCRVRYEYYRIVANKSIECRSCKKNFTAYDMNIPGAQPTTTSNRPKFSQQKDGLNQGNSQVEKNFQKTDNSSEVASERVNGKRRKDQTEEEEEEEEEVEEEEPSESCESGSSSDSEEDMVADKDDEILGAKDFRFSGDYQPRRSSRNKQQVSYDENVSDDDDFVRFPKKAKGNASSSNIDEENGGAGKKEASKIKNGDNNGDQKISESSDNPNSVSTSKKNVVPEFYAYPDPDFSDFDKGRKEECFAVGQAWAIYDTLDGMPRFYAKIKKVFSSGFKLRIIWLEPDPDDEDEIKWVNKELPVSCGKYALGDSENTQNHLMFSHMISCEEGNSKNVGYAVYPRKGETWALFRNWDMNWNCGADANNKYEYEFVEILSDYVENVGIHVASLGKIKGFSSLFCRSSDTEKGSFHVPGRELYRFSHMVPSFKMTGEEREDVPKGSFELDPASLPTNLEEISILESYSDVESVKRNSLETEELGSASPTSNPEAFEIPDPEFHDFDADKLQDKFQVGQIWALYSDEDGLPKYYGQIKNIESKSELKLHINWLHSCALPNNTTGWRDKKMPICCGIFNVQRTKSHSYTCTGSFSHLVRADPAGKSNRFSICPRKGEVWALYKNWTAEIRCDDLLNCEYDMVEIMKDDDLQIEVLVLERVDGFNSVFKAQVKGKLAVIMGIPQVELLRFSHQLPAFRLTEERGGSLRGFWEVDPAALPIHYFS